MSGAATFEQVRWRSTAEPGSTPLASAKCGVAHAERGRVGVHLRHEGGDAPGVPAGEEVGVVVGRVHEQPAEHLLLGDAARRASPARWSRRRPCRCRSRRRRPGVTVMFGPGLVERQRVVVQHDVGRHQLGQAGHRHRLLGAGRHVDADGRDGDRPPARSAGHGQRARPGPGRAPVATPGPGSPRAPESGALSRTPTKTPAAATRRGRASERASARRDRRRRRRGAGASARRAGAVLGSRGRTGGSTARAASPAGTAPPCRGAGAVRAHRRLSASSSSGVMSTARALEPSLGPTTPRLLEQVHQPAGPGEARPAACAATWRWSPAASARRGPGPARSSSSSSSSTPPDHRAVRRRRPRCPTIGLGLPALAPASGATTSRTSSSETQGAWRRRGMLDEAVEQQHVALADQPLGARLVEDDPAVGQRGHREGHAARDVGLDHPGDDVDRRALGGDARGGCRRRGPSGRCARWSPRRRGPPPS